VGSIEVEKVEVPTPRTDTPNEVASKLGTTSFNWSMLPMLRRCSSVSPTTLTATGTSCSFSSRFWAVTTTSVIIIASSGLASWAMA
jgi:hypothetical protein